MMLENYHFFFIGCVGAIAPEILRLYRLRNSLRFTWSWGYIVISIVFVLLGGFVAYILEPSNNYAAFYSGVGTPFIINAITKETQEAATPQEIPVVKHSSSDTQITVPKTETEVTRVDKGISNSKVPSKLSPIQERELLKQQARSGRQTLNSPYFSRICAIASASTAGAFKSGSLLS